MDLKAGTKISKNFEIDSLITDINELIETSKEGSSIYVRQWNKMSPASFITSMQLSYVIRMMNNKHFYTIKKI